MLKISRQNRIPKRHRIELELQGTVVYVVGDVHGCYKELLTIEQKIIADAEQFDGRKIIVMLGDYIDRGPDSARVLSHLLQQPRGFERICLAGNHETALLDYLDGKLSRDLWLASGGAPTLLSYGVDPAYVMSIYPSEEVDAVVRNSIPPGHVEFLRALPIMAFSDNVVFVHAGIRPGIPLEEQAERDLLFIRSEFFENSHLLDRWVIHGHTPVKYPKLEGRRLNIDTGAYMSGRLTAVRIAKRGRVMFS